MAGVRRSGYDARLSAVHGTVRFDIKEGGSWRLRIDDRRFDVLDGDGDAELVLACDERTFVSLLRGELNFVTALLRGLVRADGDLTLALKLHGVAGDAVGRDAGEQASQRP